MTSTSATPRPSPTDRDADSTQDPRTDSVDGRRARGQRRRASIIEAALAVVQRDGATGVSHRAVAREADIPVSLVTYYFATLDDLLVAALTEVAQGYAAALRAVAAADGDRLALLAEVIATSGTPDGRGRALAERELSTLAARRPALRPIAQDWRREVAAIGATLTDDPVAVQTLVAAADGVCAAILLSGEPADPNLVRRVLARSLGRP